MSKAALVNILNLKCNLHKCTVKAVLAEQFDDEKSMKIISLEVRFLSIFL